MALEINLAGQDDSDDLVRLFQAIETHYWLEEAPPPEATKRHVRENILGKDNGCEIALARIEGVAVALATFTVVYPAPGLTGQLYMKDLFTSDAARGQGVGEAMMRYLARLARERGCSRLDWTAETGNPRALAFYDRLGARRVEDKVYFRLDKESLAAFAAEGDD